MNPDTPQSTLAANDSSRLLLRRAALPFTPGLSGLLPGCLAFFGIFSPTSHKAAATTGHGTLSCSNLTQWPRSSLTNDWYASCSCSRSRSSFALVGAVSCATVACGQGGCVHPSGANQRPAASAAIGSASRTRACRCRPVDHPRGLHPADAGVGGQVESAACEDDDAGDVGEGVDVLQVLAHDHGDRLERGSARARSGRRRTGAFRRHGAAARSRIAVVGFSITLSGAKPWSPPRAPASWRTVTSDQYRSTHSLCQEAMPSRRNRHPPRLAGHFRHAWRSVCGQHPSSPLSDP